MKGSLTPTVEKRNSTKKNKSEKHPLILFVAHHGEHDGLLENIRVIKRYLVKHHKNVLHSVSIISEKGCPKSHEVVKIISKLHKVNVNTFANEKLTHRESDENYLSIKRLDELKKVCFRNLWKQSSAIIIVASSKLISAFVTAYGRTLLLFRELQYIGAAQGMLINPNQSTYKLFA